MNLLPEPPRDREYMARASNSHLYVLRICPLSTDYTKLKLAQAILDALPVPPEIAIAMAEGDW